MYVHIIYVYLHILLYDIISPFSWWSFQVSELPKSFKATGGSDAKNDGFIKENEIYFQFIIIIILPFQGRQHIDRYM